MKDFLVKVHNKNKINQLESFCNVLYILDYYNFFPDDYHVIVVRIDEKNINKLKENKHIIDCREIKQGLFRDFNEALKEYLTILDPQRFRNHLLFLSAKRLSETL